MNQLAIAIVVILFPGILATIIADKVAVHSKWDSFKFSLYALVLGILSYLFLQLIVIIFDLAHYIINHAKEVNYHILAVWNMALQQKSIIKPWEIGASTFLSVLVGYFASFIVNYKILNKIGQKLKITTKYGDENLYSFYLNAEQIEWIYIRDIENNLTYQGRLVSYSENKDIQEIVLTDVTVYRYKDSAELYSVPSIYLCKKSGNFIIEAIPNEYLKEDNNGEGQK